MKLPCLPFQIASWHCCQKQGPWKCSPSSSAHFMNPDFMFQSILRIPHGIQICEIQGEAITLIDKQHTASLHITYKKKQRVSWDKATLVPSRVSRVDAGPHCRRSHNKQQCVVCITASINFFNFCFTRHTDQYESMSNELRSQTSASVKEEPVCFSLFPSVFVH